MHIRKLQGQAEKQRKIYYEYDADSTPLGEGGMGIVYRGYCVEEDTGIRKEVAIKALHTDLPEEVYARAEREASIRLRHDNLVEMLALISMVETTMLGETVYRHYVISELLHGVELSDVLAGKFEGNDGGEHLFARELFASYVKDKENTSCKIIKSILSGVLALHDKGYIHRDIDPSNIMVTDDRHIKLIDFGIAKNLKSLGSTDKLTTATGKFIGKAEYASPELVLGDVKSQNYTTDIYALGILFFRLLTGSLPFTGSQYEVMQCQLKKKVPVNRIQSKALARVVGKATEKSQKRRYGSIAEFRVAIDAAENRHSSFLPIWGKYAVVILAVAVVCYVVWQFASEPDDSNKDVVPVVSQADKYIKALALLDSDNADSAKIGFERILDLADENYEPARVEAGVTFFSGTKSDVILKRRSNLGMSGGISTDEFQKIIDYMSTLDNSSAMTPEACYILGCAYFYCDKHANVDIALKYFEKALGMINSGKNASHGYDVKELKHVLERNIRELRY
ncbi:MAG: serine/threonine protein kinase [Bacteroidetes bacterium]|uniref:Serine/threonine protein kinase n=1 Tax=Candidatus Cryptobacteroides faecipullorum TaxID=2840764 RepID=A0A9D9I760_9BACT|nr:serine/threonine protein kinase [Candidatus Cryptobacteroides faecipullorum]